MVVTVVIAAEIFNFAEWAGEAVAAGTATVNWIARTVAVTVVMTAEVFNLTVWS